MNQPTPELLPCLHCGSSEIVIRRVHAFWQGEQNDQSYRNVAVCCGCGAQGPAFGHMSITGEKTARQYWNHRAPSPVNAALRDALELSIGAMKAQRRWMGERPSGMMPYEIAVAMLIDALEMALEKARAALAAAKLLEQ